MGRRGELWVVIQLVLFIIYAFVPPIGPAWLHGDLFWLAGWLLGLCGVLVLAWSAIKLGHSLTPFPKPLPTGELVTSGAYRFVRHPIYFGILLSALGLSLLTQSPLRLLLVGVLVLFFDRKARMEEQWLAQQYPQYSAYKSKVKKLIPWIY